VLPAQPHPAHDGLRRGPLHRPGGGFFHFFEDGGSFDDRTTRHLLSSTLFVVTRRMAARRFARREHAPAWRDTARHGLRFLHDTQRDPHRGGYAWLLRFDGGRREVIDATPPRRRRRRRRGRIPRARATAGCGP